MDSDRKLKYALNELTAISNSAITQPAIQRVLKQRNFMVTYETKQEINNLINHPMITSFSIYSNDRLLYKYNEAMTFKQLSTQSWFQRVKAAEGRPIWIGPGEKKAYLNQVLGQRASGGAPLS